MSLSAWVICFVSIRFDLDIGPVVEHIVPSGALSSDGINSITQVAFPDCNPECAHDLIFFFHMKDCTLASEQISFETSTVGSLGIKRVTNIYGATYYRQKKDASVPRGYVQQAIVLLSRLPYMAVHELILRVVVPRFCQCCSLSPDVEKVPVLSALSPLPTTFFEIDSSFNPSQYTQEDVLERALEEIEGWPSPHPHVQYNLTLLHQPFTFVSPRRILHLLHVYKNSTRRGKVTLDNRVVILGANCQSTTAHCAIPLYTLLNNHLHHLTRLWELLICHESLFIWSNTPSMASAVAFAVASLVQPLDFGGVLRSYLTVQDRSFNHYSRLGKAIPFPTLENIIVAATNPFFFRAFEGWTNCLTVIDQQASSTGSIGVTNNSHRANGDKESVEVESNRSDNTIAISASVSNEHGSSTNFVSLSKNEKELHIGSPSIFTYTDFFPTLTAAKQKTVSSHSKNFTNGAFGEGFISRQNAVNMLKSSFSFLVDHNAQTAILLNRLEQASRLDTEAQLALLSVHALNDCGNIENSNTDKGDLVSGFDGLSNRAQFFFQHNIADDIVRKFFSTLTMEFLMPVSAWFQNVTKELTLFQICNPTITTSILTPESFMKFLKKNPETVPSFLSRSPYKAYNAMYKRFAMGSLFFSFLHQFIDKKIRQFLEEIDVKLWAFQYPSEDERVAMFITLFELVEREVFGSIDPDVVFVACATSVLAEMVVYINEPLRDKLVQKIRELKI